MNWLAVLRLIPGIIMLLKLAEQLFLGAKTGTVKKDFVTQGLEMALGLLVSAGVLRQGEDKEVLAALTPIIDELVAIFNQAGIFKHGGG